MKTYLVSITEVINSNTDLNVRQHYVVPSESEESALEQVINLTGPLMDDKGYPVVVEIVSPLKLKGDNEKHKSLKADFPNAIRKGDIVSYKGGWRRVTRKTAKTVNLGSVHGSGGILKSVPIGEVKEDSEGYYNWFSTTETYQCS